MTGRYKEEAPERGIIGKKNQNNKSFFDRCILDGVFGRQYNKNDVKELGEGERNHLAPGWRGRLFCVRHPERCGRRNPPFRYIEHTQAKTTKKRQQRSWRRK